MNETHIAWLVGGSLLCVLILALTRANAVLQQWISVLLGIAYPLSYVLLGSDVPVPPGAFVACPLVLWYLNRIVRRVRNATGKGDSEQSS